MTMFALRKNVTLSPASPLWRLSFRSAFKRRRIPFRRREFIFSASETKSFRRPSTEIHI